MKDGFIVIVILFVAFVVGIITIFYFGLRQTEICQDAGYDGHTTIRSVPFCYRVQNIRQIEYLRYDMLVRKE